MNWERVQFVVRADASSSGFRCNDKWEHLKAVCPGPSAQLRELDRVFLVANGDLERRALIPFVDLPEGGAHSGVGTRGSSKVTQRPENLTPPYFSHYRVRDFSFSFSFF